MKIAFLAPRYPPQVCGVGDNTRWLAEAMLRRAVEVSFIHRDPQTSFDLPVGAVDFWDGTVSSLEKCVTAQQPDWLWVQVSGYGYSRWGAPFRLGQALRKVRRTNSMVRIVICLHETHCRPHQLGIKGPVLAPWQRHTVGKVARLGDIVFVTIPRYREQAMDDYGICAERVFLLPAGSNIPVRDITPEQRRSQRHKLGWTENEVVAVTFGSFETQMLALNAFERLLVKGMGNGLDRMVCIGGNSAQPPKPLASWSSKFDGRGNFEIHGFRPYDVVADVLSCCDIGLSPSHRASLDKSSSFQAFAAAGLAVIVPPDVGICDSHNADLPVIVADKWEWSALSSPWVRALRHSLRQHSQRQFGWDPIAVSALSQMQYLV